MNPEHLELAQGRTCGSCRLCCKLMAVGRSQTDFEPEIGAFKPQGQWCPRACEAGCSIYETRPRACREFSCAWLSGLLAEDLKPSKSRVVVSLEEGPVESAGPWWVLYEGRPGQVLGQVGDRLCERLLRIVYDGSPRPVARMDSDGVLTHIRWPSESSKIGPWQPIKVKMKETT